MNIYQGPHLSITLEEENNRIVQFWKTSPNCLEVFKSEMLIYTSHYKKYKPLQSLWLQQNFTLTMDFDTQNWIEKNVNTPCMECGNEKVAFVVSKDVLAHISVINVFDERNSIVVPRHYASEQEARSWLDSTLVKGSNNTISKITYKGVDGKGNAVIEIKAPSRDIKSTLNSLKGIIKENEFMKINLNKYTSLTKREKEILHRYAQGEKHQDIADKLFLSLHTVRTHWRNIKQKLEISSVTEALEYSKAFHLKNTH